MSSHRNGERMKISLMTLVLAMGSIAMAGNALPKKLVCISEAKDKAVQVFQVTDLDTNQPDSTILDTSLLDFVTNGQITAMNFSNECDNSYDLTFYTRDLWNLESKQTATVTALLRYYNADEEETTLNATCSLE